MKLQKRFLAAALGFFLASAVFSASAEAAPGQSSGENSAFSAVQTVKKSRSAPSRAGTYRPYKGGENAEPARKGLPPRFPSRKKKRPNGHRNGAGRCGTEQEAPTAPRRKKKTGIRPSASSSLRENQQTGKLRKKETKHRKSIHPPDSARSIPIRHGRSSIKDDGRFDKDFRHENGTIPTV